ncbi:hypothetical protein PUNSTDRAFT_105483 [Punctularia strigosozonata HHB-11173 SS5]|uniref:uncharacterized protein n=1 Tax=Punctularia strigosozonata (strain HHB-11173) TaxID=741275 RepID=UPI0004416EA7|nr:uncharacterized protein PUNSTDRAFT_105483 [Punctularia strigosozonata HHB-11173 SS5]EIN06462.1 hypothetical protein PUNSTDRAFT_105483 [Punctularia strigosozonata HHB-11173 SS5]
MSAVKRLPGGGPRGDRSDSGPSRAPSPTYTAFSGISNYRNTGSMRDAPPPLPSSDSRNIARTHFEELRVYLREYLAREPANSRSAARQKLTRLTRQQFQELSTDVYDELLRRKANDKGSEVPFLPVRDEFHPKRNQARQKLATLPTSRFQDLSSDVYYELSRRYPEFLNAPEPPSPASEYDEPVSPELPSSPPPPVPKGPRRPSEDMYGGRSSQEGYSYGGRSSQDRRRPSEDRRSNARSEDPYGGVDDDSYSQPAPARRGPANSFRDPNERRRPSEDSTASRRKPSADTSRSMSTLRERERERDRDREGSVASGEQTAMSGMVIPSKSTIAEEEIEVPYGRDGGDEYEPDESPRTARSRNGRDPFDKEPEPETGSEGGLSPRTPQLGLGGGGFGGLSGLSARLREVGEDDEPVPGRGGGAGASREVEERMRRDYEAQIKELQGKIKSLEREVGDVQELESRAADAEARVRQLEDELENMRQRTDEQSATMRSLRRELDELREDRARDADVAARRAQEDDDEIRILRERCEVLEQERGSGVGGADHQLVAQLQTDMEGLLVELSDLSRRNDELMNAKDADLAVIRDLDAQMKEYKRKYELAKTELRSVKATSQLFLQAPRQAEDQLPVSRDGGILDIHVTAFLTAIDALLTAGRSNSPTRVLTPMKAVVNAVSAILDDTRAFERRTSRDVDVEALRGLQERCEATLGNLVAASKTHAQSAGMSPVSLLDAAASHVSATVTEIGKTLCIRKATKAEQEQFAPLPVTSPTSASNGFLPSLRSIEERATRERTPSASSSRRGDYSSPVPSIDALMSPSRMFAATRSAEDRRPPREPSERSSSNASSPPPIFDQVPSAGHGATSDDSGPADGDGTEDAWLELKPYLEAQTESIVYAIQSVLSGVRSPTPPPTLNENLTQIITIVASIVAVCKDNLPPASAATGNDILRELSDHANKLSEVQSLPELTKDSRQMMAKSSFAIANAMKGLMKL